MVPVITDETRWTTERAGNTAAVASVYEVDGVCLVDSL